MRENYAAPPLDRVADAVINARIRMRNYAPLRESAALTRAVLVAPLLRALEWEIADPDRVALEYAAGDVKADYALLGRPGYPPVATLRVYPLNTPLDGRRPDVRRDAGAPGVVVAAGTNGDEWEIHRADGSPAVAAAVSREPAYPCALRLLELWELDLASRATLRQVPPAAPKPVAPWLPLDDAPERGRLNCRRLRLPDGAEAPAASWRDVKIAVAAWLHRQRLLRPDNCVLRQSDRSDKYIANRRPWHSATQTFTDPERIGDDVHLETRHQHSRQAKAETVRLLEHCGVAAGRVSYQVGPQ